METFEFECIAFRIANKVWVAPSETAGSGRNRRKLTTSDKLACCGHSLRRAPRPACDAPGSFLSRTGDRGPNGHTASSPEQMLQRPKRA